MVNEKRFKKGVVIESEEELRHLVLVDGEYVYLDEKPLHPRFVANFSLRLIDYCLRNGRFFRAELN